MTPFLSIEGLSYLIEVRAFHVVQAFQDFSRATLEIRGDNRSLEITSSLLDRQVSLRWNEGEPALFAGWIYDISINDPEDCVDLVLQCVSLGHFVCGEERIFRSFQQPKQTLRTILDQIKEKSNRSFDYRVYEDIAALDLPYYLGLQCGQTDFDYLVGLLGSFGIPVRWDDEQGFLIVGNAYNQEDKTIDYDFKKDPRIRIVSSRIRQPSLPVIYESAALGVEWRQPHIFSKKSLNISTDPSEKEEWLEFITCNQKFQPGDLVKCDGQRLLRIISVEYNNELNHDDLVVKATGVINPSSNYIASSQLSPPQKILATVIRTSGDPENLGRVQVAFPWERLGKLQHAWLPVITHYQGQFEGLFFLPEQNNRVIVECLDIFRGLWTITGTLRTQDSKTPSEHAESSKTIRTSLNNIVTFFSTPSSINPKREEISIQNGKNIINLISDSEKATVSIHQSDQEVFRISTSENGSDIKICHVNDIDICTKGAVKIIAKKIVISGEKEVIIQSKNKARVDARKRLVIEGDPIDLNP